MKQIILIFAFLSSLQFCNAQTFDEWFKQKKTQLKYLAQQIAALQVYASSVKKGYQIIETGTGLISDIKHGDYSLHNDYFNSLKSVNKKVKSMPGIQEILSRQLQINRYFKKLLDDCRNSGQFDAGELNYLNTVHENLMQECSKDLVELSAVITPAIVGMKDDERIRRINKVENSITDKYSFTLSFCSHVYSLKQARLKEQQALTILESLHQ